MFALVAKDLDKSSLAPNGCLPAETQSAAHQIHAQGAKLVVATGRPWRRVKHLIEGLPIHAAICNNGITIVNPSTQEFTAWSQFRRDVATRIIQFARSHDLGILMMRYPRRGEALRKDVFFEGPIDDRIRNLLTGFIHVNHVMTDDILSLPYLPCRLGLFPLAECAQHIYAELKILLGEDYWVLLYQSPAWMVEILPRHANKWWRLEQIARSLDIEHHRILSFGDDVNDARMLEMTHGVAMNHAPEQVRSVAKEVVDYDNGLGVARALHRHFRL